MATRQSGWFRCPSCGQVFTWKPQLANRRVRCKCATRFVVPPRDESDQENVLPADVLEEIAPPRPADVSDAVPFAQRASIPARSPLPLPGSTEFYTREIAQRARRQETISEDGSNLKHRDLPIALILAGLLIQIASLRLFNELPGNKWGGAVQTPSSVTVALAIAICQTIIWTSLLIIGSAVSARILGISFGTIGRAALKLCGIATFTFGVASAVASIDPGRFSVTGIVMALHIVILLYWVLFAYLFSLEIMETLMTVAIVVLIQSVAVCGFWKA